MNKKYFKRTGWALLALAFIALGAIFAANRTVEQNTTPLIYSNVATIPHNKAGLLLGTSKTLRSGKPNQYFQYRIDAAVALFKSGKIDCIVISGDNGRQSYNEPEDMKAELIKQGIPEKCIYGSCRFPYIGFSDTDGQDIRSKQLYSHLTRIPQP